MNQISVSIARQPIFDAKRQLWGYELFGVGCAKATSSGFPEEESVATSMAAGAYIGLQQILGREKKIIVNFNEKSILDNLPYALPPVSAAVNVTENVFQRPNVPELLTRLKSDGYLIAVTEFTANSDCDSLYSMADIIGMEVSHKNKDDIMAALTTGGSYSARLLARRVKDPEQFKVYQKAGFSLFHGSFFKSPDEITVRKLSSNQVSRLNLMQIIEKDTPDFGQLAKTIQADVSISFRLLAYLNSVAFGFSRKIKSVHQAISLLGWRKMKNWLRVVILNDVSQSNDASELVLLSAQRGKFLELIARAHDFWGFNPDSLHLLGLFSLLDALLGLSMTSVVEYLPLENKLKSALCNEPNNEYVPLLKLAFYFEEARWPEAEKMIQQLSLDREKVKEAFQASVSWAGALAVL